MEDAEKTVMTEPEAVADNEEIVRPYELRDLKDRDLFPLLKILKRIGIKDCKEAFLQVASGEKTLKQVGILASFDLIDILIGNIGKAEDDIYALWSDISGISIDDMKEMEFGTLPMMIMDSFSGVKNTGFFRVLSRLL